MYEGYSGRSFAPLQPSVKEIPSAKVLRQRSCLDFPVATLPKALSVLLLRTSPALLQWPWWSSAWGILIANLQFWSLPLVISSGLGPIAASSHFTPAAPMILRRIQEQPRAIC